MNQLKKINNFPVLYARTNTGAIQQWCAEVVDGAYRTFYGQVDGKIQATEFTNCEGKNVGKKNETTPYDQAIKEVLALYKKKKKEGYRESIDQIDEETFFQVQLADKFSKYADTIEYPVAVEDKLNGIRCVISKKGAYSRTGEEFFCLDHIKQSTAPLFEKYPDLILDGELFNPDYKNSLNVIASLVSVNRKQKDTTDEDREKAKELIKFHVYDGFNYENITQKTEFIKRKESLEKLVDGIEYVCFHPYEIANSEEDIHKMFEKVKEENREGLVIKILSAPYLNKRSRSMLKLKVMQTKEFKFVRFIEGTGDWYGKVKKVVFELDVPSTNGKTQFESNIKGSMDELEKLWKDRSKYEDGKEYWWTVEYQERSPYGVPLIPYCDILPRIYE